MVGVVADWVEIPNKPGLWRTGGIDFVKVRLPILAKRRIPVWYWPVAFAGAVYGVYDSPLVLGISAIFGLVLLKLRFGTRPASGAQVWLDSKAYVDQQPAEAPFRFNWSDVETAGWVNMISGESDFVVQLKFPIPGRSGSGNVVQRLGCSLLENEYRLNFSLLHVDPHLLHHAVRQLIIRNGGTVIDRLR